MIYFIRADVVGYIKIGHAGDPAARLADLQTASPVPLSLIQTAPGGREEEADLHCRFAGARLHGEWFLPTSDLLAYIEAHPTPPNVLSGERPAAPISDRLLAFWHRANRTITQAQRDAFNEWHGRLYAALDNLLYTLYPIAGPGLGEGDERWDRAWEFLQFVQSQVDEVAWLEE